MPEPRTSYHYVWSVEGKPVSAHLSTTVLERLKAPSPPPGQRAREAGGILLGYIRQAGEHWLVAVEDIEAFPIEHARGESWTLSGRDRKHLEARLRQLNRQRHGHPVVVGWFRHHTRPGFYLDQHDFHLFRDFFAHPASIALLTDSSKGSIFFWEGEDMQRSKPYKTFPLPESLEAVIAQLPDTAPAKTRPRWVYAAPIAAGLALGLVWNPKPLDHKARFEMSRAADRSIEDDTERAVFSPPPPATIPENAEYTPPPEDPNVVTRSRKAPPVIATRRPFVMPQARPIAEPVLDTQAPAVTSVAKYEPDVIHPARRRAPIQAAASIEPVRPSALRRVVGSIPGMGFLKRQKHEDEEFIPAKPIREFRPRAPYVLTEDVPVKLRLTISPKGEVQRAELLSRHVEAKFAELALDAARRWRFEPAKLDTRPVPSELILQFRFAAAPDGT